MTESVMRRLRFLVLEVLYEAETSDHDVHGVLQRQLERAAGEDREIGDEKQRRRAARMLDGTLAAQAEADRLIAAAAPKYPLASLAVVDRNILRLAIWELLSEPSAPIAAVVNEAVELAHRYGGEKSPSFVNGVLRTVSARITADRATPTPAGEAEPLQHPQEN